MSEFSTIAMLLLLHGVMVLGVPAIGRQPTCNSASPLGRCAQPEHMESIVSAFNARYVNDHVKLVWDEREQRSVPRARKKIRKGDVIVAMTASEALTAQHAEQTVFSEHRHLLNGTLLQMLTPKSAGGFQIDEKELLDQLMVALLLLTERAKGDQSRWAEYLNLLPPIDQDFRTAAFMSTAEAQCLGPWAKRKYRHVHRHINRTVKVMKKLAEDMPSLLPSGLSVQELRWALSIFSTRSAALPAPHGHGLVPWLDMLNHHSIRGLGQGWHVPLEMVYVKAAVDVQPNDEVFDNFGDFSVQKLMMQYGFLDPQAAMLDAEHWKDFKSLTSEPECWNEDAGPLICGVDIPSREGRLGCTKGLPNSVMMNCAKKMLGHDASEEEVMSWGLLRIKAAVHAYEELVQHDECHRKDGHFPLILAANNVTLNGLRYAAEMMRSQKTLERQKRRIHVHR